jgi:2-aminoadipate transaminase
MWVTLAEGLDAGELLTAAFEQKLAYIPGANFSPAGLGANTLRLNYSNNTPERIAEGVRRLGLIVRQRAAVHA